MPTVYESSKPGELISDIPGMIAIVHNGFPGVLVWSIVEKPYELRDIYRSVNGQPETKMWGGSPAYGSSANVFAYDLLAAPGDTITYRSYNYEGFSKIVTVGVPDMLRGPRTGWMKSLDDPHQSRPVWATHGGSFTHETTKTVTRSKSSYYPTINSGSRQAPSMTWRVHALNLREDEEIQRLFLHSDRLLWQPAKRINDRQRYLSPMGIEEIRRADNVFRTYQVELVEMAPPEDVNQGPLVIPGWSASVVLGSRSWGEVLTDWPTELDFLIQAMQQWDPRNAGRSR